MHMQAYVCAHMYMYTFGHKHYLLHIGLKSGIISGKSKGDTEHRNILMTIAA